MNKEKLNNWYIKHKPILVEINNSILRIGLAMLLIGIGATYQAEQDVHALNESLYTIATHEGILSDGTTYYFIGLYENKMNFSSLELINRSQCDLLYGSKP